MLRYWSETQAAVLESIPGGRLLVIKTEEISSRLDQIEKFVGLPPESLDPESSHSHRTKQDWDPLENIPSGYLRECVETHTAEFRGRMEKEFIP